jgi:hypothetical protein
MAKLISDKALAEIDTKVKDILQSLFIDDWQSEPHHQHQNYAKRHYSTIKSGTNIILNKTGAPGTTWLLCLKCVCYIFNDLANQSIDWQTPLQLLTGEATDISILLLFTFYEEVYYSKTTTSFPSKSTEELGNFAAFGEHVGDAMTFIILTRDTNKFIYRSNVQYAEKHPNLQISPDGEVDANNNIDKCFIQSKYNNLHDDTETTSILPGFDPANLIGREYIDLPVKDGVQHKVCILKVIVDHIDDLAKQPA